MMKSIPTTKKTSQPGQRKQHSPDPEVHQAEPGPVIYVDPPDPLIAIRAAAREKSESIRALMALPHVSEEAMKSMLLLTKDFLDGI